MSYEDAIAGARKATTPLPEFGGLAERVAEKRVEVKSTDEAARLVARRWLYLAAAAFLLVPTDLLLRAWALDYRPTVEGVTAAVVLPALMLGWAARLVVRPEFASQVLVRAIAASNLVVALLMSLSVGGIFGAFCEVVIAVSCFKALQVLGERGLDASDADSAFKPVAFRGFLIFALIMAFADAQTLLFSTLAQLSYVFGEVESTQVLAHAWPTFVAAVVMAVGVWGLFRLRTWAMLLNIVANLVIARMALTGALGVNLFVAASLAITAAVQLMLPVPILAAWAGDREAGGRGWSVGAATLRGALSVALVFTVLGALWNFGLGRMWGWIDYDMLRGSVTRGVPNSDSREYASAEKARERVAQAKAFSGGCHEGSDFAEVVTDGARFEWVQMSRCKLAGAKASDMLFREGIFAETDFRGATLHRAGFVGGSFAGANFARADLTGSVFFDVDLDGVTWTGATCPDGFLASEDEGCEGHLDGSVKIDPETLERRLGTGFIGCRLAHGWADGCAYVLDTHLRAAGDSLEVVWDSQERAGEISLARVSPTRWESEDGEVAVMALPRPSAEPYLYLRGPMDFSVWSKGDLQPMKASARDVVRELTYQRWWVVLFF